MTRSAYRRWRWSRRVFAGIKLASAIRGPIGVVFMHPVIALASQFIMVWGCSVRCFWFLHHISALKRADV